MPILVGFLRPLPFFPYHLIGSDTKQSGGNRGGNGGSSTATTENRLGGDAVQGWVVQ
jgi:hypothetical protein